MEARIEVAGSAYDKSFLLCSPEGQEVLRTAKASPDRPRCLCCGTMPEMYVSRRGGTFHLARMPGSAHEHAEGCRSHVVDVCHLRPDDPSAEQILNRLWTSMLEDRALPEKRYWAAVRESVLRAVDLIEVDGLPLAGHILVPETFSADAADRLHETYEDYYRKSVLADQDNEVRYWTLGILKDMVERQFSHQATLKHMPRTKFWVDKLVASTFPTTNSGATTICLFSCRRVKTGVEVDEAATLTVNDQFRPLLVPPLPSPPSDHEVQRVRESLGLSERVGRDQVFGALVRLHLDAMRRK